MLNHEIAEKVMKEKATYVTKSGNVLASTKKQIGILVAGVDPKTDTVAIGYSLCSKTDVYDKTTFDTSGLEVLREKGYGRELARIRALTETNITVPASIQTHMMSFIERCKTYYKDKTLPAWTEQFSI